MDIKEMEKTPTEYIEYENLRHLLYAMKQRNYQMEIKYYRRQQKIHEGAPDTPEYTFNTVHLQVGRFKFLYQASMEEWKDLEKHLYKSLAIKAGEYFAETIEIKSN